jgi:hypothetical protein
MIRLIRDLWFIARGRLWWDGSGWSDQEPRNQPWPDWAEATALSRSDEPDAAKADDPDEAELSWEPEPPRSLLVPAAVFALVLLAAILTATWAWSLAGGA